MLTTHNIGESYAQNLLKILTYGYTTSPRGMEIKELLGATISGRADKHQILAFPEIRDISNSDKNEGMYLIAELLWYFSGSNRTEFISLFGSMWDRIKSEDGTINSNYGRSVFYDLIGDKSLFQTKFDWALNSLKNDPDTRQAIIHYVSDKVFMPGCGNDFTCTQLQHFFIRDNKLQSIVYIRSSDSVFGLNYDIPFWSIVCQIMFRRLKEEKFPDLEMGDLTIFIGSSHIYQRHYKLCSDIYHFNHPQNGNVFKTLKIKNEAFGDILEDWEKYQMFFDDLNATLLDCIEIPFSSNSRDLLCKIKSNDDPEDPYFVRMEPVFWTARMIMNAYRFVYYTLAEKGGEFGISEENSKKLKEIMKRFAKTWFRFFFEIVAEPKERNNGEE